VKCEVNLDYIEHTKTWGYYSCAFVYKFKVIWLYESYMIMQDRIGGACIDLFVSLDIRFQRLRFLVRFFVWSDMIIYDIDAISDMIGQESVIDLIIWFLALGRDQQFRYISIPEQDKKMSHKLPYNSPKKCRAHSWIALKKLQGLIPGRTEKVPKNTIQ
jgi:hypothetical protein